MKKALVILGFCFCVAPAILPARAGTIAGATQQQALDVPAGESRQLLIPGVTAAYAVDATIAEASSRSGVVTIAGKSAGTTRVVVVTMDETRTIDLVVVARINTAPIGSANAKPPAATVETRYTSSTRQVTNVIDVAAGNEKRRTEVHLMNVHETGRDVYGARTSFPSASYAIITPRQKITFLDSAVDNSPLTLSRTNVRGFHLENDSWRIHAGYTGAAFYDALVLPVRRELVFGASYVYRLSPALRLMPSLYYYPSRNADGDRHGAVASLLADYGEDDSLRARGEIGISRGIGGAFQLDLNRSENRLHADVRYEPRRFAGAGPGDLHGFYSDASWSGRPSDRVTALVEVSANHYILPRFEQRTVTSNAEVRLRATRAVSIFAGLNFGDFKAIVPSGASARSLVAPAGFSLDFAHGGLTALARFGNSSSSSANRGFRVSGRVSGGGFFVTAYVDRLTEAPTLQLIFRERPDLALALEQLGLTADSPQDIARLLRDNAALFNLGFIEGATVDLSLLRTQAGLDVAWLSNAPARHQLRLRLLHDRSERVAFATTSDIATLSYSRRLTGSIDVQASLSMWTTKSGASPSTRDRSVDISVRKRFDDMPSIGTGTISGRVFSDEEMRGEPGAGINGIEGVEVQLDGARNATTDTRGRYAFSGIPKGTHHVAAHLPAPASYFTTASQTEAAAGDVVDFGIASTPARLVGRVVSDAGLGVGGVVIELTRGDRRITATTAQDGHFSLAAPPGEWHIALDHDSLASLYVVPEELHEIVLEPGTPKSANFAVTAIRSVAGRVPGRGFVEVVELGRRVNTDAEGNFVLRSMPAGEFTLVGHSGKSSGSRKVSLSREPVSVRDLVIDAGTR